MASKALVGNEHVDAFVRWGVAPGPALWPAVLRILFVIDGRVNTSKDPGDFGLGYALETLRDPAFAWWVRFSVQVVRRDQKSPDPQFQRPIPEPAVSNQRLPLYRGEFQLRRLGPGLVLR